MQSDDIFAQRPSSGLHSFGRVVNAVCLVLLLVVIGTVIYGLVLRAEWERSYWIAVVIAVMGGFSLLVGLAQQEIAARDKATWRAMAEWQLRATYAKVADRGDGLRADSESYQEQLIEALIEDMRRSADAFEDRQR